MGRRSSNPQAALGRAIRALRAKKGATQETLAHEAGITVAHLSGIERGHANPTWGTVEGIASALDVSMEELARTVERHKG